MANIKPHLSAAAIPSNLSMYSSSDSCSMAINTQPWERNMPDEGVGQGSPQS